VTVVQRVIVHRHQHSGGSTLPFTGFDAKAWGLAAILLVTMGAGLNIVARRRSTLLSPYEKSQYPVTVFDRFHHKPGRHGLM
jgi:hypothetical protein